MQTKYLEALSTCLVALLRQMTDLGPATAQMEKGDPLGDLPVAMVIEYRGREAPLRGFFVLGFPSQEMALALANSLGAKMGLAASPALDQTARDLLGEFLNTVVGRAISAWDHMGLPVNFGPPSELQQAQIQATEGFQTENYRITLALARGKLVLSTTFSQSQDAPQMNRRVLVVEDSRTLRHALVATLAGAGYDLAEAGDGEEAVEMYPIFRPAVVIMDLVMPKMGGLDAIVAIRELDPQARFVVLTSSDRRDEVVTAKTLGVLDYLLKPFENRRLLEVVGKACGVRAAGAPPASKARSKP